MGKNELKQEFIKLRAKGYSYREIQEKINISRTSLCSWANEFEEEIANLKAIEMDALYHSYYLNKKEKIKMLGGILKKIKVEALSRDFSKIKTNKLLELLIRYQEKLEEEKVNINLLSDKEIEKLKFNRDLQNTDSISVRIDIALIKYKAGIIDKEQFSKKIYALKAKLKAKDQEVLEDKLNNIENILNQR